MFRAPVTYDFMVWHSGNRNTNGLVWHVGDSKAWVHIDAMWLGFVEEPQNVKLCLTNVEENKTRKGDRENGWPLEKKYNFERNSLLKMFVHFLPCLKEIFY